MMKKTYSALYFSLFIVFSFAQQSQTHWKSELDFGGGISMTTFLRVDKSNNQFTITSPKNADVRIFGGFKARLGRLLGKSPKKGILLTINGIQKGDSLFGNVKMPMFKNVRFRGVLKKDIFSGELIKNDTISLGDVNSIKTNENKISYEYLFPKIEKITENNIYSKKVLKTKKWRKFNKKIKKLFTNAQDDIEIFLGFNILSSKLSFSHYNLFIQKKVDYSDTFLKDSDSTKLAEKESTVIFQKKSNNVAYLKINNFSTSQNELAKILPKIVENKYKNLIIDLRNNGGGGVTAAFEFGKYVLNDSAEVGYFVTNKLKFSHFNEKLFKTLPNVKPFTTEEFAVDLKKVKGLKLIFPKSEKSVFKGNLYILTNNKTASTCEPIVYLLKNRKTAIIIGERTAGKMLSAAPFNIFGKYILGLPIADFYTYDGVRIEGIGVKPDFETTSDEALNKALFLIKEQENK